MAKDYKINYPNNYYKINENYVLVGYVCEKNTKKRMLMIVQTSSPVPQGMCVNPNMKLRDDNGEETPCALISLEFASIYLKNTSLFEVMVMHELSHLLQNDIYNEQLDEYRKKRASLLERGQVHPFEINADRFASEQCGIEHYCKFIDFAISLRKRKADKNAYLAIKEYELRKQFILEDFKKRTRNLS